MKLKGQIHVGLHPQNSEWPCDDEPHLQMSLPALNVDLLLQWLQKFMHVGAKDYSEDGAAIKGTC